MTSRGSGRSTALLVIATTLWGASSAVLAKLGEADATAAPLLAAGGAATLVLLVSVGPARSRIRRVASAPRHLVGFLVIGLLEALNLGLYAAALALGPIPVVVALHLTSPLLLVTLSVVRGQRRVDAVLMLQVLLMVSGIALLGKQPTEQSSSAPILAYILAVGSAMAVAALITAVAKQAPTVHPDIAAAAQLMLAAIATAPVILVVSPPDLIHAAILLGAGGLFLGPGFAIYWRALRGANAATASIIGLNEAVAATIISVALLDEDVSLLSGFSGTLILAAIALEVRPRRAGRGASTERLRNKSE